MGEPAWLMNLGFAAGSSPVSPEPALSKGHPLHPTAPAHPTLGRMIWSFLLPLL